MNEVEKILYSMRNCVYLTAFKEYEALIQKLNRSSSNQPSSSRQRGNDCFSAQERESILKDLAKHRAKIELLKERVVKIQQTLQHEDTDNWVLGHEHGGIKTHYCKNSSDNSIKLKMEGTLDNIPLYEQFVVLHEMDLYHTWAPLCLESKLIEKPCIGEFIGYVNMGMSLVARDMLLRAYGVDCLASHGKFLVLGHSELNYSGNKHIPFKPTSWLQNRMECKEFRFVVDVLSPTKAKISIVTHILPNSAMPARLLNFVMKNLAGVIISVYHRQVQIVASQYDCLHAQAVRANPAFYTDWLLSGMRQYCDSMGWPQPSINCLGLTGSGSGSMRSGFSGNTTPSSTSSGGTPKKHHSTFAVAAAGTSATSAISAKQEQKNGSIRIISTSGSSSSGNRGRGASSDTHSVSTDIDETEWEESDFIDGNGRKWGPNDDFSTQPWFGL